MTARRALALAAVGLAVAVTIIGVAFLLVTPPDRLPAGLRREQLVGYLLLQTSLVVVGALLSLRRPGNLIGWLLTSAALASAGQFLSAGYAVYGLFQGLPGATVAAWLYSWTGISLAIPLGWLIATFPDGRLRSRAARMGVASITLGSLAIAVSLALRPGPLTEMPFVSNPFGWDGATQLIEAALAFGVVLVVVAAIAMFKHVRDRAREAASLERQQLKWFVWSVGITIITVLVAMPWIFGAPDPSGADATVRYVARLATALATALFPIGIAFAILRYRLYDIDVLINRTLVYGALSVALAATYAVAVVLFQAVLRPLTGGSELAVAASTLGTLALVQPLRRRIQEAVDRRFYRWRYDAARTVDAFASQLRNEVDIESVRSDLIDAVYETLRPRHVSFWLRDTRAHRGGD